MKIAFFSDIHGVAANLELFLKKADEAGAEHLVLLGDALYHGPRNGVPEGYDPIKTKEILNSRADSIIAVRGNCDADVDQMMLDFPVLAEFSQLLVVNRKIFITHGHVWNQDNMPPIADGWLFAQGHTHVPVIKKLDNGVIFFNPGSISLPKQDFPKSYGLLDDKNLSVHRLDNAEVIMQMQLA
jgi:putative phosphoesterase